jgi:triacylglycerol esterase/lipase EstA (alpha/beta hydrolase family)
VLVLVRALIFTNNFRLSARHASVTPADHRIGAAGALRLWGEEFVASMLQSSWHTPRGLACQRLYDSAVMPVIPVLLLHGYGCNSGYWHHLRQRLDAQQISHACIDLQPVTGDIDAYAAQIEQAAAHLATASGASAVIVVAHSMGGLAARAWLRAREGGVDGRPRMIRLVTLGSPHHGTCLANLGVGANAAQMRRAPGGGTSGINEWLAALAASETARQRARITSIFSHHDNIIAPQTSSLLDGARNLAFGGVGHVALGCSARILDAVMTEIRTAQQQACADGQAAVLDGKLCP